MNPQLKEKIMESLAAVLPITGIVLALSILLVPLEVGTVMMFIIGAVLLIFGMAMFQPPAPEFPEPENGYDKLPVFLYIEEEIHKNNP